MNIEPIAENKFASLSLPEIESKIKKCEKPVLDYIELFRAIRDGKKYLDEGFKTFELYCQTKWSKSVRAVQLALQLGDVRKSIAKHATHDQDTETAELAGVVSDRAIRKLAKVPKEKQKDTLKEAAKKSNGKPTAKDIADTAARQSHKPLPQKPPPARAILGTDAPIDASLYTGTRDQTLPPLGTKPPKRTDTPPENERGKDVAELIQVTDKASAVKRLEQIWEDQKPWFNLVTTPMRPPRAIFDKLIEGMNE